MRLFSDLLGTVRSTFRIGSKASSVTLDTSLATAVRNQKFQDKDGTLALLSDVQQQIFIGSQPAVAYPALSFTETSPGSGLYIEAVNVP